MIENQAPQEPVLGIVIVNYQTPDLVEECLASLAPMLGASNASVVIVDNDSMDGSFERLTQYCSAHPQAGQFNVVKAGANRGFSAGNNIGVARLNAKYILLLNSDAKAKPAALQALIAAAEKSPQAGVITPRIVSSLQKAEVSRFRNHTPRSEFIDGAQTGPLTNFFPSSEVPIYPDDWNSAADWVSFAAVLIRMDAIKEVGPMDEGFFLYYEDCDYCRRIRVAGYEIAAAPDAVFVHDAGGSTKLRDQQGRGARLPAYFYASRSRYFRKYYGPAGPAIANLAWYAGRAIAKLRGLAGRPAPKICKGRLRDMWIGWKGDVRRAE